MTFLELVTSVYANVFPTGQAPNLVAPHLKMIVDALIDLQNVVECLQQDNTDIVPQCGTFYECGLTLLAAPRGMIKKVSIIDKTDPTTHLENPALPDNYCDEIPLNQVDSCHVKRYLAARGQTCCGIGPFFGFGFGGFGGMCGNPFPIPTDAGLPAGLKPLPFGVHYAQTSTDRKTTSGQGFRSRMGIWALDRGNIYIAPWIQSTETVIIVWDGIKRKWADDDGVDDDPLLQTAVEEYLRWGHADRFDKDDDEAARAAAAYDRARSALIHQCREETRTRECEPSFARSSVPSLTTLFYNTTQQASATCPDGSNPVTVTIPAGSVSSSVSVAVANQLALTQAQAQANAQLVCTPGQQTWQNTPQSFTAQCATTEPGAPPPDGSPVTITIPAGTITSTVSQADANSQALLLATERATALLACKFWNAPQSFTAICPADHTNTVTITVNAHTFSSTISQADADQQALTSATNQANTQLAMSCGSLTLFQNTTQIGRATVTCPGEFIGGQPATVTVETTVPAGTFSASTQALANQQAQTAGNQFAAAVAALRCTRQEFGDYSDTYPIP